jgi:uncharacterized protein YyaL (SSP411 family)
MKPCFCLGASENAHGCSHRALNTARLARHLSRYASVMNRLASETSPYLRQHANNPVDWWPWNAEALAAARGQEKPILLSIGYSACHWCHVMAHESFEDEATARVMNDLFICIKVDREERPDLDKIYQLAHQALTRRGGGWPLTVFLTPDDHLPFYAGTYFPKTARYGMPPFAHVLRQVRAWWDTRRDDVRAQNATLGEFLRDYGRTEPSNAQLDDAPIHAALEQIERSFDAQFGGHTGAPKFPHCPEMELLLDLGQPETVEFTLARMAAGGIHDQLGGGFCRYSVDERWEIPHFEKMLYDNAQLVPLYARTDANVAGRIVDWLAREMSAPSGGFYSALDADSEHEEGKFYVWQRDEVRALLSDEEFAAAAPHFGFDRAPNFENHAWNPIVSQPIESVARELRIAQQDARARVESARTKLFAARESRVRPGLDDKVLTAWNALMIAGLARYARDQDAGGAMPLAERALDFLHHGAWRDGRLYAKAGEDAERFPAYLDDCAFLLDALLEMLQSRWSGRDIAWAIQLADALLARFEDREHGGFWFTADDHETLIQRPKSVLDDAVPGGNGVAARALLRLGHLLGEPRYLDAAERTLRAAYSTLQQMPQACASLLRALNDFLHPRTHVVIRFDNAVEEHKWRSVFAGMAAKRVDAYLIPVDVLALPGTLAAQEYVAGGAAYICRGTSCQPPISDPSALTAALR